MKKFKLPFPAPWTAFTTTDNKSWSFARVTSGAVIFAALFWVTFLVIAKGKIPENLTGLSTLILSLYGVNRVAEAYENRPPQPPAPPTLPQTQNVNIDAST